MNQPERVIGQHADLDLAGAQPLEKPLEAWLGAYTQVLRDGVAPLSTHGCLRNLRNLHVLPRERRVADHSNLPGNTFERLAGDFDDR